MENFIVKILINKIIIALVPKLSERPSYKPYNQEVKKLKADENIIETTA